MALQQDFRVKKGIFVSEAANVVGNTSVGGKLDVVGAVTIGNNVVISGNLTVSGTTTYVNTAVLNIADNVVTLNADVAPASAPIENAGIEVNRGSAANSTIMWNEASDRWDATGNTSLSGAVAEVHVGGSGISNSSIAYTGGSVVTSITVNNDGFGHLRGFSVASSNLDSRYSQVAFANIAVSGQTTLQADAISDQLTLVGSGGISITTDAAVDAITFNVAVANATTAGVIKVVNSVSNTDTLSAAAASAVKTSYDAAISANTLAASKVSKAGDAMTGALTVSNTLSTGNTTVTGFVNASSTITGAQIISTVDQGTAPLTVTSTTVVANLNADLLDGQQGVYYTNATNLSTGTVAAARLPQANTTANGAVILLDSVSNTSVSVYAPTMNAVKTAYDAAITANTNASNASFLSTGTLSTARLPLGSSGAWFNTVKVATVSIDGVLEVGRYIDFHSTSADTSDNTFRLDNSSSGVLVGSGTIQAVDFNSTSDVRKKTNVSQAPGVEVVEQLRGVEFKWADTNRSSSGVIAQELEQVLPHLVTTGDDGFKSVNYSGLVAYLIEAVKQLSTRVRELETKQ